MFSNKKNNYLKIDVKKKSITIDILRDVNLLYTKQ